MKAYRESFESMKKHKMEEAKKWQKSIQYSRDHVYKTHPQTQSETDYIPQTPFMKDFIDKINAVDAKIATKR